MSKFYRDSSLPRFLISFILHPTSKQSLNSKIQTSKYLISYQIYPFTLNFKSTASVLAQSSFLSFILQQPSAATNKLTKST